MSEWVLRHSPQYTKALSKLDPQVQRNISRYLAEIIHANNPRIHGLGLKQNLTGYWRYRVGDYRVIVEFIEAECIVVAVDVGHRSRIYRS